MIYDITTYGRFLVALGRHARLGLVMTDMKRLLLTSILQI